MKKRLMKIIFCSFVIVSLSFASKYYLLDAEEKLLSDESDIQSLESVEDISSEEETVDTEEAYFESEPTPSQISAPELLSLDFEETEIRDVVRVLAEVSGINIIVGPDVKARVTVQLRNVTWDQALDVILRTYNLTFKREANLVRVMTLDQMKIEEEKIPLTTKIIHLNFARAEEIVPSLEKMKSARGSIQTNTRTNSLIITDLPEIVQAIEEIAVQLDSRTPQVMIEALMADVKLTGDEQFGINWDVKTPDDFYETTFDQDLTLTGTTSAAIAFGKTIFHDYELDALINMWKEDKRVDILANPKVMTLDNLQATIELIEEIPYTYTSTSTEGGSVTSTQFKESGIKLFVTPHITTKDNWISMNVQVEQSFKSGVTATNEPIIDSRKAETNLMVKNKETIVIGGLRKKEDSVTINKVPFFGDVPLLGHLFRRTSMSTENIDLLIFITPTIIEVSALSIKEEETLELFRQEVKDKTGMRRKLRKRIEKRKMEEEQVEPGVPTLVEPSPEEAFSLRPPGKED